MQNLANEHPQIVEELIALAKRYVLDGPSTTGLKLNYVSGDWKQIDWAN